MLMLISLTVSSQTVIEEGPIEGTWLLSGSPYLIEGTTTIEDGTTLTIDAGVQVIWQGSYTMYVQGQILALGNETDSILFTAADPEDGFRSIRFENTPVSNDSSKFEYCKFEYGRVYGSAPDNSGGAFAMLNFSKIIIDHCLFYKNKALLNSDDVATGGAISMRNSNPIIKNNTFLKNESISAGAIFCYEKSSPKILNNLFDGNNAYYISGWGQGYGGAITCHIDSDPEIKGNIFMNNKAYTAGGAIGCVSRCNPIIDHNLFYENWASWLGGAIELQDTCSPQIINNTIVDNTSDTYGGAIDIWRGGTPQISNTILWGNTAPSGNEVYIHDETSQPDFYYSDIKGGMNNIGNNEHVGEFVDIIVDDPVFVDPPETDFHLTAGSPCIDAGHPAMTDPDGTRCDIGVFYYDQAVGILPPPQNSSIELRYFPNPFTTTTTLSYELEQPGLVRIVFYNQFGEMVDVVEQNQTQGSHEIIWSPKWLPVGMYFFRLESNNKFSSGKVMKMK